MLDDDTLDISGDFEAVNDRLYELRMTDGLPVVPPTRARVDRMLAGTARAPDDLLGLIGPEYREATVEKIAINAVMAGCRPEYMPVILAAVEAMLAEEFNLYGINATTHPVAPLLVVNGPIVEKLRINYGYNAFGQGWRANATIGRATRLILINIGGGLPGEGDRATHGHPGKFTYCVAENEKATPWDPLHVQRGLARDQSAVTVLGAEAPHEINDHSSKDGSGVLMIAADTLATLGNNNAYLTLGEVMLVFGPEHAETVARDGWTLAQIRDYLFHKARNRLQDLIAVGKFKELTTRRFHVDDVNALVPLVERPEDILVMVAGGAGKHSLAIHTFGMTRAVTRAIAED